MEAKEITVKMLKARYTWEPGRTCDALKKDGQQCIAKTSYGYREGLHERPEGFLSPKAADTFVCAAHAKRHLAEELNEGKVMLVRGKYGDYKCEVQVPPAEGPISRRFEELAARERAQAAIDAVFHLDEPEEVFAISRPFGR